MNPQDCYHFDTCSCNVCPLDPEKGKMDIDPADRVRYCLLERRMEKGELPPDYLKKLQEVKNELSR